MRAAAPSAGRHCARNTKLIKAKERSRPIHVAAHNGGAPASSDGPDRRRTLAALTALVATPAAAALADAPAEGLTTYTDSQDKFTLSVPAAWRSATPEEPYDRFRAGVSSRRTIAWFPEAGTDINVTIVITTPGADYVSLGSFGSPAEFGSNLVASMDRSYMLRGNKPPKEPVMVANLVSATSSNNMYSIEYTVKKGDEEGKHLYSRIGLGDNGHLRRFYTVTATCPESKRGEVGALLEKCVASLKLQPPSL